MSPVFHPSDSPKILAIAGGSCSGKTTLAAYLRDYLGADICRLVRQDDYYHDINQRGGSPLVNFDIPDALDFDLLRDNLLDFKRNKAVRLPNYDFTTHQRRTPTEPLPAKPIIIVEGILLLTQPNLRELFDYSVFIECGSDLRLSRRLARDTAERGRTPEDVTRQFRGQVEPAQQSYVTPSQIHADFIITQSEYVSDMTKVVQSVANLLKLPPAQIKSSP